jgi:hypothetical protein
MMFAAGKAEDIAEGKNIKTPRPKVNWVEVYKKGAPSYIQGGADIYKIRLLIGDEFIDGIFLMSAVKNVIAQLEPRRIISGLQKWCSIARLNYDTILTFIRARDDIIEQLLAGNIDVFKNEPRALVKTEHDGLMSAVTRIKLCIYDGFKLNVITRRDDGHYYTTNGNIRVLTPALFHEDEHALSSAREYGFAFNIKPTILVYRELNLKLDRENNIYSVICDRVSSLDGFVNWDPYFTY